MKQTIARRIAQAAAAVSVSLIPLSAFAQSTSNTNTTLCSLAQTALGYFNTAIEVIIALAVVVFVYNVFYYFFTTKENKDRGMYLLWSIIGFAVILCFWGLVNLVANTFNLDKTAPSFFGSTIGGTTSSSGCSSTGTNTGSSGLSNTGSLSS
ncbi:MAG: hypothetical protein P4L61_04050 [Candidatus Pacebacteria bacterium]|nr:hypothetical protein [Candidatus Paceibacterota bacterium]